MRASLEVPTELRRGKPGRRGDADWLEAGRQLLDLIAASFDLDGLVDTSVLDVGCGTKLASAIVNLELPIGRYVGVDTDSRIIEFLSSNVDNPALSFHLLDAHNELYNTTGQPLSSFDRLPVPGGPFDVVTLFSVFTHLAPHDFRAMLKLTRTHVVLGGGLLFSLFIDEGMDANQRAALNQEIRRRRAAGDPEIEEAIRRSRTEPEVPDFVDRIPERPLLEAVYSEPYARRLIAGTGWEVVTLHKPQPPLIQHHFTCRAI